MLIVEAATVYCASKHIAKTPVYNCKRFAEHMGNMETETITQEHIDQFVSIARKAKMPESTIRGTVKDVRTIVMGAGGVTIVNHVRKPKPDPKPCEISDIDAIWNWLAPWCCQLVVMKYWTGARLEDAIKLQLKVDPNVRSICWEASKTKHKHRIPVPKWLNKWLHPVKLPYTKSNDYAQDKIRDALDVACLTAKVPRILPSQIRDRGITEWSKVSSDAGALLHGHGLGTRDHYVPAMEILTSAMDRVRVPAAFGASSSPEESFLNSYRRLDPHAQGLLGNMAERLAVG